MTDSVNPEARIEGPFLITRPYPSRLVRIPFASTLGRTSPTKRNGGKVRLNEPSTCHWYVPGRRSLGGDSPFQRRVTHERCSLCNIEESSSGKTPLSVRLAHHRKTGLPRRIRVDPTEIADQQ